MRPKAEEPLVVRGRRVRIDFEAFAPLTDVLERGAALPVLRLNLFEDVVVESLVEPVGPPGRIESAGSRPAFGPRASKHLSRRPGCGPSGRRGGQPSHPWPQRSSFVPRMRGQRRSTA